jgi:ATP-dependent DNA ligase
MVLKTSVPRSKRQYVEGHNTAVLRLVRSFPQAKQAIFPGFIPPSLATLAPRPPRGEAWLHEIKYDGYRFQCHIQRKVRFYTRRGNDWTDRLGLLVNALQPLAERSMILDGEVIVETRRAGRIFTPWKKNCPQGAGRHDSSSTASTYFISAGTICGMFRS